MSIWSDCDDKLISTDFDAQVCEKERVRGEKGQCEEDSKDHSFIILYVIAHITVYNSDVSLFAVNSQISICLPCFFDRVFSNIYAISSLLFLSTKQVSSYGFFLARTLGNKGIEPSHFNWLTENLQTFPFLLLILLLIILLKGASDCCN